MFHNYRILWWHDHQKILVGGRARTADFPMGARRGSLHAPSRGGALYGAQHPANSGGVDVEIHRRNRISRGRDRSCYAAAHRADTEELRPEAGELPL